MSLTERRAGGAPPSGPAPDAAPGPRPTVADRAGTLGRAVVAVAPPWVVSRLVVAATLVAAHLTVTRVRPHNPAAALRVHQGLLSWDGGWYQSIAAHGYGLAGEQSLRFFPVFPLAGRVVGRVVGSPGLGVLVVANACALLGMAALYLLVRLDLADEALARRSVWLLALAPPAFTLVMGYAEGTLLLCSVVVLLAARTGRWWWAAAAGLVAGAVRPIGLLVVVPVVVEVVRARWAARPPAQPARGGATLAAQVAAVVAPVVGAGGYLWWVAATFGDFLLPFRVQTQTGHRGPLRVPFDAMWHDLVAVAHGHHVGTALHLPWVLVSVALLVVAFRRLPASYGAFAAAVLAVSVASSNLDSFERYALSAFPLVVAASTLTSRRWVERTVLVVAAVGMVGYAYLAFVGSSVP